MKKTEELHETLSKLDQISPTFCLAKWKNATLHLHNGNTQSCHHVKSHKVLLEDGNPASLHNTPQKQLSRLQMLKGERPPECEYCWKVEDKGFLSDRVHKSAEATYMNFFDEVVQSKQGREILPSFLEVSFDHTCQFQCLYCSPAYSTQWEKDIFTQGEYPTLNRFFKNDYNKALPKSIKQDYIKAFWSWWPKLRDELIYLRVTGGEPLLSKETYKLMSQLIAQPQKCLNFAINTNLGFTDQKIQDLAHQLNQLKKGVASISVFTSVDSTGEQAEYIRHGLNYRQFIRNINKLLESVEPTITLCFVITVNILSLPGLEGLITEIAKIKKRYPIHQINIDTPYLKNPGYLSVELLPHHFRHYVDKALQVLTTENGFSESERQKMERIHPLVGNTQTNKAILFLQRQDFSRFIHEYDRRKKLNFKKTFPEYQNFLETCQSPIKNMQSSFL